MALKYFNYMSTRYKRKKGSGVEDISHGRVHLFGKSQVKSNIESGKIAKMLSRVKSSLGVARNIEYCKYMKYYLEYSIYLMCFTFQWIFMSWHMRENEIGYFKNTWYKKVEYRVQRSWKNSPMAGRHWKLKWTNKKTPI